MEDRHEAYHVIPGMEETIGFAMQAAEAALADLGIEPSTQAALVEAIASKLRSTGWTDAREWQGGRDFAHQCRLMDRWAAKHGKQTTLNPVLFGVLWVMLCVSRQPLPSSLMSRPYVDKHRMRERFRASLKAFSSSSMTPFIVIAGLPADLQTVWSNDAQPLEEADVQPDPVEVHWEDDDGQFPERSYLQDLNEAAMDPAPGRWRPANRISKTYHRAEATQRVLRWLPILRKPTLSEEERMQIAGDLNQATIRVMQPAQREMIRTTALVHNIPLVTRVCESYKDADEEQVQVEEEASGPVPEQPRLAHLKDTALELYRVAASSAPGSQRMKDFNRLGDQVMISFEHCSRECRNEEGQK